MPSILARNQFSEYFLINLLKGAARVSTDLSEISLVSWFFRLTGMRSQRTSISNVSTLSAVVATLGGGGYRYVYERENAL